MLAPRGVGGEFRARPHRGSEEVLCATTQWFVQPRAQTPGASHRKASLAVALDVQAVTERGTELAVRVSELNTRAAAEQLRGAAIFVSRAAFPPLPPGRYYWIDLIGLRVIDRQGGLLGTVRDLMETGPSQALVVDRPPAEAKEAHVAPRLIPFVDAWVDSVDVAAGEIRVAWQADF